MVGHTDIQEHFSIIAYWHIPSLCVTPYPPLFCHGSYLTVTCSHTLSSLPTITSQQALHCHWLSLSLTYGHTFRSLRIITCCHNMSHSVRHSTVIDLRAHTVTPSDPCLYSHARHNLSHTVWHCTVTDYHARWYTVTVRSLSIMTCCHNLSHTVRHWLSCIVIYSHRFRSLLS